MTDNRTTELLLDMLHAFLVDYQNILKAAISEEISEKETIARQRAITREHAERIEQAIAATLGNEYYGYEQAAIEAWKSIKAWNQRHVETCRITASATDGLCTDRPRQYFELSCGHSFTLDGLEPPNYCPNCGRKIVTP